MLLSAALEVFAVGVDEQDLALARLGLRARSAEHQDAGRDAGAVEQVRAQADHGVEHVGVKDAGADGPLFPTAEQHAVRHDRYNYAAWPQHREHVLHEHEVGLLAAFGTEAKAEPLLER